MTDFDTFDPGDYLLFTDDNPTDSTIGDWDGYDDADVEADWARDEATSW